METVIARIDEWLKTACVERHLVPTNEVVDILLDIRLLLTEQERELVTV